jgi:hypothetical protein
MVLQSSFDDSGGGRGIYPPDRMRILRGLQARPIDPSMQPVKPSNKRNCLLDFRVQNMIDSGGAGVDDSKN